MLPLAVVGAILAGVGLVLAQAPTTVQFTTPATGVVPIPISATNSVNTQTVLTIPAPPGGMSNYICSLAYQINADATGGAITNAVSTSANFNAFAVKVSMPAGVNLDGGVQVVLNSNGAVGGCAKSTVPGTATTFTSTASLTHIAWTWYATYYQAP
jgi:invasion protein IalB